MLHDLRAPIIIYLYREYDDPLFTRHKTVLLFIQVGKHSVRATCFWLTWCVLMYRDTHPPISGTLVVSDGLWEQNCILMTSAFRTNCGSEFVCSFGSSYEACTLAARLAFQVNRMFFFSFVQSTLNVPARLGK
jgi:hypothetical protein